MQATEFSELNNFLNNQKRQLTPAVLFFISDLQGEDIKINFRFRSGDFFISAVQGEHIEMGIDYTAGETFC